MKFSVELREKTGKGANRQLRKPKTGLPKNSGVVYGSSGSVPIAMYRDLAMRFIRESLNFSNKMFDLQIVHPDQKIDSRKVMLQDYQMDPVKGMLIHVDFREVEAKTVVSADVPLETFGVCEAVKLGGVMQVLRHSIKVRCQASKIPEVIRADITGLEFGDSIHVEDLTFPKGVKPVLAGGHSYTVLTIAAPTQEETVDAEVDAATTETADKDKDKEKDK